jgi:hypothetical protein
MAGISVADVQALDAETSAVHVKEALVASVW